VAPRTYHSVATLLPDGRSSPAEVASAGVAPPIIRVTVAVASSPREITDAVSCSVEEFIRDAAKRIDSE
jgi:hypothetical protein